MINLNGVSIGYGRRSVLHDVSFTADDGQITVILGRNGCGKSTLLKAIGGNLPYKGSITLDGRETAALSARERARTLSVMPQLMHAPGVSVREFVSYGRQPYAGSFGILSENDRTLVDAAILRADISDISPRPVNRLSGGERQRAFFAMLLAQDTKHVLLDEPGAHLDAQHNRQLTAFMRQLAVNGKAVVAVMHDINTAIETADQIVFLDAGSVLFRGGTDAFVNRGIPQEILGLKALTCTDGTTEQILFR